MILDLTEARRLLNLVGTESNVELAQVVEAILNALDKMVILSSVPDSQHCSETAQQERFKWQANERADRAEALVEKLLDETRRFYRENL